MLTEVNGRYFSAICHFQEGAEHVLIEFEEIDWGHFHRYEHVLNRDTEVCSECPDNVRRA